MRLTVAGRPVPKARPRVTVRGGRPFAFTPKRTADWESVVQAAYLREHGSKMFFDTGDQLALRCIFHQADRRSDGDNLYKAVADALQGFAYPNDRQIIEGSFYLMRDPKIEPHVQITCQVSALGEKK